MMATKETQVCGMLLLWSAATACGVVSGDGPEPWDTAGFSTGDAAPADEPVGTTLTPSPTGGSGSTSEDKPQSTGTTQTGDTVEETGSSSGELESPEHAYEGFGAIATGGEGGLDIRVTTLADAGPGSLRDALAMEGPRVIMFDVGGEIELLSSLDIEHGDITLSGASAPEPGITLRGQPLKLRASNVIITHIRSRFQPNNVDTLVFEDGAQAIVIDHCSFSWSGDDTIGTGKTGSSSDITIQWSIIAEPRTCMVDSDKWCGRNLFTARHDIRRVSMHHNLWLNSVKGVPPGPGLPQLEFINNIVFHYEQGPGIGGGTVDVIGNRFDANTETPSLQADAAASLYLFDNRSPTRVSSEQPEHDVLQGRPTLVDTPQHNTGVTAHAADELEAEMLPWVGASRPCRDQVDARLVESYEARIGQTVLDPPETPGRSGACAP